MTTARRRLVDPEITRWYHCISRCVRDSLLLGIARGTDRKAWIQRRLHELGDVFAVSVAGFAVLDNHLHVLVRIDPERANAWSEEEVVRRWSKLHPPRNRRGEIVPVSEKWVKARLDDPKWIAKTRQVLQSLSGFMKCLKEPLARLANKEDGCSGAFFASRFKSIAILDEIALLQVCVYIDLNPLAAGITFLPEKAEHTSLKERVEHAWPKITRDDVISALRGLIAADLPAGDREQSHWLCPIEDRRQQGAPREGMLAGFTLPKYLLLVDHTARLFREGKAILHAEVASIFDRLGMPAEIWQNSLLQLKTKFVDGKIIGRYLATTSELLSAVAQKLGLHHLVNLI